MVERTEAQVEGRLLGLQVKCAQARSARFKKRLALQHGFHGRIPMLPLRAVAEFQARIQQIWHARTHNFMPQVRQQSPEMRELRERLRVAGVKLVAARFEGVPRE